MRSSWAGRGLLAAAVTLLVSGCAGVPERSAVVPASRIEAPRVQPFAVPPASGDTPDGIVRGFLAAGKDFHQNHQVAREYLDADGAKWQGLAPVVVVDSEPCVRLTLPRRLGGSLSSSPLPLVPLDAARGEGAVAVAASSDGAAVVAAVAEVPGGDVDGIAATAEAAAVEA